MTQSFKTGDVVVLTKPTDLGRCTKTVRSVSADGKTVELDWFIIGDCNSGSFPVGDVRLATDAERKAMQSLPVCGDIASDLADKIMGLINSKPRSPTRDELVELINASTFAADAVVKVKAANPMMTAGAPAHAGNCAVPSGADWIVRATKATEERTRQLCGQGGCGVDPAAPEGDRTVFHGNHHYVITTGEGAIPNEWYLTKLEDDGTISRTKVDRTEATVASAVMPLPYKDVSTANLTLMKQLRERDRLVAGMFSALDNLLPNVPSMFGDDIKSDGSKP